MHKRFKGLVDDSNAAVEQAAAEISKKLVVSILSSAYKIVSNTPQEQCNAYPWGLAEMQSKRGHPCGLAECGYGRSQLRGRRDDIRAGRSRRKLLFYRFRE